MPVEHFQCFLDLAVEKWGIGKQVEDLRIFHLQEHARDFGREVGVAVADRGKDALPKGILPHLRGHRKEHIQREPSAIVGLMWHPRRRGSGLSPW
jgi:hypothetical protein